MKKDHVLYGSNNSKRTLSSVFMKWAAPGERRAGQQVCAQRGFTLIELLIVICIMSILTVIAVGAYAGVQRQARIDFAADTLIAALREEQVLARSGRRVGVSAGTFAGGKLQCFVLKIVIGSDGGLWSASTNYIGLPVPDSSETLAVTADSRKIDTCELIGQAAGNENLWQKRDIFDGDIIIKSISDDAGGTVDSSASPVSGGQIPEQVFYFKPPFGQIYLKTTTGLEAQRDAVFEYVVGVTDQPAFNRKVQYDVSTGEAKKVK